MRSTGFVRLTRALYALFPFGTVSYNGLPEVVTERTHLMRWLRVATVVLTFCAAGWAQDQPNPEELNRKYQDALDQLKAAQDRKNELANENEQLKARIAELEKQLEEHKRASAQFAQQTFFLRSHYAAWESFIQRYPRLANQWRMFMEADVLAAPTEQPPFVDSLAPISTSINPHPVEQK